MITNIDKFKDSIFIRFDSRGDSFAPVKNHPHYKEWIKVTNYLKRRGFNINTPKYFIEQNHGKSVHKVAYRGNVVFCLELLPSQIKIEFGDIKNLWPDWEYNFWSLTDSRSKQLSYLESKKIELEVNKLLSVFHNEIINLKYQVLSPEQRIIRDKKESCHAKDISKLDELGLDGVVYQMSDYDHSQNSTDLNKKKINCGEEKYYYDLKILKKGKVYHQLNNRWFVLSGGELDYVSSWELFDFEGQPRRKELKKQEKINRLESELRKHESKKNYIRCLSINKEIEKLSNTEKLYHVYSLKWDKWWGPNNSGYTSDKRFAGIYLESNILADQSYYNNGKSTKAVPV